MTLSSSPQELLNEEEDVVARGVLRFARYGYRMAPAVEPDSKLMILWKSEHRFNFHKPEKLRDPVLASAKEISAAAIKLGLIRRGGTHPAIIRKLARITSGHCQPQSQDREHESPSCSAGR